MAFFCILMVLLIPSTPYAKTLTPTPPSNATDLAALLAFKAQLKDPHGTLAGNWTATASFCSWAGVSCDGKGRQHVTSLELNDVPLQGSIAPHLGNLSFLSSLVLTNTSLMGPVPSELGSLRRLRTLVLSDNRLSGTIPSTLGNLTRLELLNLDTNNFTGEIPRELRNLRSLQTLVLDSNDLSGAIPPDLFNSTSPNLRVIRLGFNNLHGQIPDSIASLQNLETLVLQKNLLSGPMPPAIFNMSRLQALGLTNNNLSGSIPTGNESFHLPMLRLLYLGGNRFHGPIPSGLSACRNLQGLSLVVNNFTGTFPSWLAMLPNLTYIGLSTNHLTGKIPIELSNHTGLRYLDLSENNLEGTIPTEYGRLQNLQYLSFAGNQITGVIPQSIGNLSSLITMDLFGNRLTGPVPLSFGNLLNLNGIYLNLNQLNGSLDFLNELFKCRKLKTINISYNKFMGRLLPWAGGNLSTMLQYLEADDNRIRGGIPSTLANFSKLLVLSLSRNNISGEIPEQITTMYNLHELYLDNNSLSSTIPEEISRLTNLFQLHLGSNKLTGSIPNNIGSLSQLQYMNLSQNSLSSTIPRSVWLLKKLLDLDLSQNSLSGSIPTDVRQLTAVAKMDLSGNQLSGDIPISFSELIMINYLDLSSNLLEGPIPDSLGKLISVEDLDLSSNALSGAIPTSLANLTYLANLNLSFNRLEGQIPGGGIFSNITLESLVGNKALCGLPRLGIAQCQNSTNHSRSKQLMLKVLLPSAVAILVSASCLYLLVRRKINKRSISSPSLDTTFLNYQLISYHELVRATNNFSDDNLLGAGSFGKVFKGQLEDESFIAIKVLNMQHESAFKSFDTECRALRMARHRNLVRIISTCSNLDFKALILEYMPNGSLHDWLYTNDGRQLSFPQRVDIMLDVAMAMEYLHHQHFEAVLHCDLKPSNILLDENMTARVSDFGISMLLVGNANSIELTSMPGTIGYMAPEFGSSGKASRRSDVYSYGIVLLEVFTRKKPTNPMFEGEMSLRQWVSQAFPYELSNVVDCSLVSIIDLALLCSSVTQRYDLILRSPKQGKLPSHSTISQALPSNSCVVHS